MPRTSDVDGFTPIFDGVTRDVGLLASAVYGRVYRYAQGADSVCRASIERLATDLDLSTRTVIRYLKTLVSEGYLVADVPVARDESTLYTRWGDWFAYASLVGGAAGVLVGALLLLLRRSRRPAGGC